MSSSLQKVCENYSNIFCPITVPMRLDMFLTTDGVLYRIDSSNVILIICPETIFLKRDKR